MNIKRWKYPIIVFFPLLFLGISAVKKYNCNPEFYIGQQLDSLNGIVVYYNGGVDHVSERNLAKDGYNLGLKYQCVEFVKRYYYEHYNHKMPDSYGHAKDFFDEALLDGQHNKQRNLTQYTNSSQSQPKVGDLLIFEGTLLNRYGHVAIVSDVNENTIEIIQQNPGPFSKSREHFQLGQTNGKWKIENARILGWLRKN